MVGTGDGAKPPAKHITLPGNSWRVASLDILEVESMKQARCMGLAASDMRTMKAAADISSTWTLILLRVRAVVIVPLSTRTIAAAVSYGPSMSIG